MYPLMMQPLFSVARANLETWLRVASSFAGGVRQFGDLNEKTMQHALDGVSMQSGAQAAGTPLPVFMMSLPSMAFDYANEVFSIAGATATDIVGSIGDHASQISADTPQLVLADQPETPVTSTTAIVDATGTVVAQVRK